MCHDSTEVIMASCEYKGKIYSSKKFPMLEYIFNKKTNNGSVNIGKNITFTLKDVSEGYRACGISEPASISNTVLDLTRRNRGIKSRLPQSIIDFGYDIKKKTGPSSDGNYCGEFVFVGKGNEINSWLAWDELTFAEIVVKNTVPDQVLKHISNDEGALFSVVDYCDAFSLALTGKNNTVIRVQNPMKWQPNEIDGLYVNVIDGTIYPIEAKAISTGDCINLEQMYGQYKTLVKKRPNIKVCPIAVVSKSYGIDLAILKEFNEALTPVKFIRIKIEPNIDAWKK